MFVEGVEFMEVLMVGAISKGQRTHDTPEIPENKNKILQPETNKKNARRNNQRHYRNIGIIV